ncbi:hypothetical protein AAIR98_001312 [Elusimicrobium simillimum]|uniref:hypothetical protein n=1 Tax=Elusimicrobium simillimum TaxID=3143438 RepID=UPI003C6F783D
MNELHILTEAAINAVTVVGATEIIKRFYKEIRNKDLPALLSLLSVLAASTGMFFMPLPVKSIILTSACAIIGYNKYLKKINTAHDNIK